MSKHLIPLAAFSSPDPISGVSCHVPIQGCLDCLDLRQSKRMRSLLLPGGDGSLTTFTGLWGGLPGAGNRVREIRELLWEETGTTRLQIISWKGKGEPCAREKKATTSQQNEKKVDKRMYLDTSQRNCRYQRQRHLSWQGEITTSDTLSRCWQLTSQQQWSQKTVRKELQMLR